MDLNEIKKFMEHMDEHELIHFELTRGDDSITLKKTGAEPPASGAAAPYPQMFSPMPPAPAQGSTPFTAEAGNQGTAAASDSGGAVDTDAAPKTYIDSPMVGTFYRAPDPDSDLFVRPGDMVEEDTTVCIIESMKVMNEIKAERRGKIVEAVAGDASAVQYGEHLFVIEPA